MASSGVSRFSFTGILMMMSAGCRTSLAVRAIRQGDWRLTRACTCKVAVHNLPTDEWRSVHCFEDLPAVLGRINRLLPTGGLLISETPCFGERGLLFKLFVGIAQRVKIAPPILSLTVPELEAAIAGADFDTTESKEWDPKNAIHWIVARKRHGVI